MDIRDFHKQLTDIKSNFSSALSDISEATGLEQLQKDFLGRKSMLRDLRLKLQSLDGDLRREAGKAINELNNRIQDELEKKQASLTSDKKDSGEGIDPTLPSHKVDKGHVNPLYQTRDRIIEVFNSLGFTTYTSQHIETEHYNFDALNIPGDHPARDMWDTFWIENPKGQLTIDNKPIAKENSQRSKVKGQRYLLRTHTSPGQVRALETMQPPLRVVVPGVCYRYEQADRTHNYQFYQVEGLYVDKKVSIAHFKGIVKEFFVQLFERDVQVRLRPSYFPFVEPGFELDVAFVKEGETPGDKDWLEIAGAGIVHDKVFSSAKLNPNEWEGFAFGLGVERVAMIRYGIDDLRLFYEGDARFLNQF